MTLHATKISNVPPRAPPWNRKTPGCHQKIGCAAKNTERMTTVVQKTEIVPSCAIAACQSFSSFFNAAMFRRNPKKSEKKEIAYAAYLLAGTIS